MRLFLAMMVFTITLSGYTAAAHAFVAETCETVHMMDHDSNGHMDQTDKAGKADSSKDIVCFDCHHCCASQISVAPSVPADALPRSVLNVPPVDKLAGNFTFSLLRPPKLLV